MRKKIWFISIGLALLLILSFFPTISSSSSLLNKKNPIIETGEETKAFSNTIKMKILHIKEDGTYEKSTKKLTYEEHKALIDELRQIEEPGLPIKEMFEKKLEILKKYELVSNDVTLEDIFDVRKLEGKYESTNNNDSFEAKNAPIVFVGGGFGFGFGIPFFITSGTFLAILVGFGLVYCYDIINNVTYQLLTFFFIPMLVGYLGGFVGLLLLPVIPGFFYSNLFGIGIAANTHWMLLGGNFTAA